MFGRVGRRGELLRNGPISTSDFPSELTSCSSTEKGGGEIAYAEKDWGGGDAYKERLGFGFEGQPPC